jgi:hypothetical protein
MQDVRTLVAELTQRLQADASNVDGDGDVGDNGVDPLGMQQAVTAWRELTRRGVKPEAVLALVSAALERQSRVQLDSVQWSPVTATLEVSEESTETGVDETATEDSAALPDEAVDSGAGTTPRVRVSIRGRVEPFSGDYQQAFAELGTFIDSLRADPRVLSVTARKQPLDVNPRSTLTGEMNPALRNDEATFTVDLLVRLADEPA